MASRSTFRYSSEASRSFFFGRLDSNIVLRLLANARELLTLDFAKIAKIPFLLPPLALARLFLDDISEPRVNLQHSIAHGLQEVAFRRLGGVSKFLKFRILQGLFSRRLKALTRFRRQAF